MSNKNQPGTFAAIRDELTKTLVAVAPIQARLYKPTFRIRHLGPGVATVTLVGMRFITAKQYMALESTLSRHKPLGVVLIFNLGRKE